MTSSSRIQLRRLLLLLAFIGLVMTSAYSARGSQAQGRSPSLSSAREAYGQAQVAAGSLNLRTGPHTSYTAIAYLMEGERIDLVGRNQTGTWAQVRLYNGYRGWVNANYIKTNVAIDTLPVVDVSLLGIAAFVTDDPVPVYTGPGTAYQLIDRARPGDVLALNGRNASVTWVHVYLPDGRAGWAATDSSFLPWGSINDLPILSPFLDAPPPDLSPFFLAYSGPGFLYDPVDRIAEGQSLEIIARTSDNRWIQARLPGGREGWIASEIVRIDAALAAVPVAIEIAPPQGKGWMPGTPPTKAPGGSLGIGKGTTVPDATGVPSATAIPDATATPDPTDSPEPAMATATPSPGPTEEPAATPPAVVPIVYVYAAPGDDAAPFLRVVPGQSVVLIGRTADSAWIKIWLSGDQEGWVRADALQLNVDVAVLPVVAP